MSIYYLSIGITSLSLSIYNFKVGSKKGIQCLEVLYLSFDEYINFNISRGVETSKEHFNGNVEVLNNITNNYPGIINCIGSFYFILFLIGTFLCIIINSLNHILPSDFLIITWKKRVCGMFCKIIPKIINLLSWIIFIFIITLFCLIGSKNCKICIKNNKKSYDSSYYKEVLILNIINICFWIALHYGGGIIRQIISNEPFMYSSINRKNKIIQKIIFDYIGP